MPRSKLPHQLDHVIKACKDHARFRDAGSWHVGKLIESDHRVVMCKLSIRFLGRRKPTVPRAVLARLDYSELYMHLVVSS